ncbi:MAG: ABC transporter permease [Rhodoferax sp.]|nr:ABC transporter permease [Rhodoferax sp.]
MPRWLDSAGRDFARSPILMLALSLVLLQVLASLCANLIAPFDPVAQAVEARMAAPGGEFLLGTDKLGRDVLSRILHGYRSSLGIAFSAVAVALLLGGSLGIWAAYKGGWIDRLVMRLADVLFAFPIILLAIGVIAVLGSNTLSTVVAIAVVYSPIFARLMRAPTLVLRNADYVHAARSFGASDLRIIVQHIMPNLMSVILVQTSLSLSTAILLEASLSFLGIGAQPPAPSLGRMLSEGRDYMFMAPWASLFSGLAILLASLGFNLLGDGLRDRLDPRLRGID